MSAEFADAGKLRDYASALIDNGVAYSMVIAALAIGEARSGNRAAVQRLVDCNWLFRSYIMDAPDGYDQISFCRALAAEIKSDLTFNDAPPMGDPARFAPHPDQNCVADQQCLATGCPARGRSVHRRSAGSVPITRFQRHTSRIRVLSAWGIISNGASYHAPHIHVRAWLSGVFYVIRPQVSRDADRRCGWLEVGPPEELYGVSTADGWAARTIEPEPGCVVLMPGYFFHGTHPMGVDEERICIAFDVVPVELAGANGNSMEIDSPSTPLHDAGVAQTARK